MLYTKTQKVTVLSDVESARTTLCSYRLGNTTITETETIETLKAVTSARKTLGPFKRNCPIGKKTGTLSGRPVLAREHTVFPIG